MVARRIETQIPTIEDLRLPEILKNLAMTKRGLVIFVGATGTGKSTSLASMIGYRNKNSTGFFFQAEDGIRDGRVTGVQTCALPILRAMDQPSVDGINTFMVSREARRAGFKVALSGLGGDEVFAGYETFRSVPRMERLRRDRKSVV